MAQKYAIDIIVKTVGGEKLKAFNREVNKTSNAIQRTNGSLDKSSKGYRNLGRAAKGATGGVKALGASISAALGPIVGVTTAMAALGKAVNTAFERDAAENRLKNLAQTTGDYEYALAAAREASEKFGFTLTESTKLFGDAQARIGTLGYNVEQVNEIFTGFNVVARQAGVSSEDAAGAFTQLAQGMAAGTLQGDELRSILERMPAVTKLLADEMGAPVEQIKELGSSGQITSDIIYKALSRAAKGADELGNKLTPTQKAFMDLKKSVENAFNTIGQLLEPVIVPATKALTAATQALSDVWQYLAASVFPKVQEAFQPLIEAFQRLFADFDWNSLGALITNAIVLPFEAMTAVVQAAVPIITWIVNRIAELANSPLVQTLTNAVTGLLNQLGLLKNPVTEFKKEIDKSQKSTEDLKGNISEAKVETQSAADASNKFAEAQKSAADETLRAAEASQQIAKGNQALYQAEYDMKKAINDIAIENSKIALDQAKNMQQVKDAAEAIFHVTEAQAALDRDLAKFKADAAVNELRLKQELLKATLAQVEAEKGVLIAKNESTKAIDAQIAKTKANLKVLQGSIEVQERIKEAQYNQADAIYKQTVAMAKLAQKQNIKAGKERISAQLNKQIEASKKGQTAELEKQNRLQGEINAKQAQSASSTGTPNRSYTTQIPKEVREMMRGTTQFKNIFEMRNFYKAQDQMIKEGNIAIAQQKRYNDMTTKAASYAAAGATQAAQLFNQAARIVKANMPRSTAAALGNSSSLPKYASGGYVNGAQTALIGEAGPEYVIPANRMDSALANYAAGKRGNAVLSQQVNVTTGPVQQMDGTNYVTLQQATSMSQSAARQGAQMALTQIKTDPGTRRAIGVGS